MLGRIHFHKHRDAVGSQAFDHSAPANKVLSVFGQIRGFLHAGYNPYGLVSLDVEVLSEFMDMGRCSTAASANQPDSELDHFSHLFSHIGRRCRIHHAVFHDLR